jgi:hypothetical protein
MSRARALLLALVGLALPVGLALGVYVASAGSLAAVPSVVLVQPPEKIARSAPKSTTSGATTTEAEDEGLPGKCRDPKHQLDPDCDPRSAADDDGSSGQGSGGGDDDSSGHGSSGTDDSSGHGSGDDD